MDKCAKCGACTVVCPVYNASGNECYSARGKNHLLEVYGEKELSSSFEDIFAKCLLCGACNKVCPRGLDITGQTMATRSRFSEAYGDHGYEKYIARKVLGKPELLHGARFFGNIASKLFLKALPMESGLRLRLAMFDGDMETLLPSRKKTALTSENQKGEFLTYFPGCSSSYLYPKAIESTRELVGKLGFDLHIPEGLGCCGLAMEAAGDFEAARKSARQNIEVLEKSEGTILVTCGSCWAHLKNYPELFDETSDWHNRAIKIRERLAEITQHILSHIPEEAEVLSEKRNERELRVFYHDPCHLRNENNITSEPREILNRIPGVKLVDLPDGPQCCGQGGLFHLGAPKLSAIIRDDLAEKVLEMKPDVITTTCSGCYMQWRTALAAANSPVKLVFLTELVNDRLPI